MVAVGSVGVARCERGEFTSPSKVCTLACVYIHTHTNARTSIRFFILVWTLGLHVLHVLGPERLAVSFFA